jgi:hypothetical protein
MCQVAGVLSCGGIWNNGKGWGVTWKFVQCMVKPNDVQSVVGRPMFQLSSEMNLMESNDNDKQKSDSFNHENPESFDAKNSPSSLPPRLRTATTKRNASGC